MVKIMLINGCCGFRFIFRFPPLHAKHLPPRSSCILRKSLPNSLKILHLAHCLHHARRVGFCHHPALSNSGSCCPLHQEPSKSKTGLSLSSLLASCQSKRPRQAWILLAFSVASCQQSLPEPQTSPCRPSPLQFGPLLSGARLLPFQRSLCPSCACLLLPIHRAIFLSPFLF